MGRELSAPFVGKDKFLLNMPLTTGFAKKDTGIKKSAIMNKKDIIKKVIRKNSL